MKIKKITAIFFILVLALQLLPIKQAIRYFFNDNPLIEEFVASGKGATKNFKLIDEDYNPLHGAHTLSFQLNIANATNAYRFTEKLPALYISDILTPPPNSLG